MHGMYGYENKLRGEEVNFGFPQTVSVVVPASAISEAELALWIIVDGQKQFYPYARMLCPNHSAGAFGGICPYCGKI